MYVIYQSASGIGGAHLPTSRSSVEVSPAAWETVEVSPETVTPQIDANGDPLPDLVTPALTETRMTSAAVYRDETTDEMVARMIAAGHMPDLPWANWLVVAGDHAAAIVQPSRLAIGDWSDASTVTVLPQTYTPADLTATAADKRRRVIADGTIVTVAGTPIPTWSDADTQAALTALVVAVGLNSSLTTSWRGRNGQFYPLDAAGVIALATGVMTFVQTAFAVEAAAGSAIAAGTITTPAQIDALGWPS